MSILLSNKRNNIYCFCYRIKAMLGAWRIREIILLGLCLIGGGTGGLLAMDLCNHKVKSMHFVVGVPMMICAHLVLIVFIAVGAF